MGNAIQLKVLDSGVAVITIDLAQSKVNVLSTGLMAELEAAIDQVAANSRVKGLVIVSGKDDNFIAGANLEEIVSIQTQPSAVAYNATQKGKAIFAKLGKLPYNTVAAVHGVCLGGGTELALACSHRLVSDSAKTKLGLPEVGLGFLPGWGGTVRLPKLIGAQAALELILQPLKSWDGKKAWRTGMVDEIVPADKLMERAQQVALTGKVRRASQPLKARITRWALEGNPIGRKLLVKFASQQIWAETRGNYPAPPAALKVVLAALTQSSDRAFDFESQTFARLAVTPESRNLVSIFFSTQESKKSPGNVRPEIVVKKVGVLGAGVMGAGIAQAAAYAGYTVVLYDKFEAGLAKGKATIADLFNGLVEKRKLTRGEADAMLAKITFTATFGDLVGCDMVVEAIVEDLGVKKAALAQLEQVVGKDFIFATNTSSLSVTKMATDAVRPDRVGGLHFFNPVHKMPLVEVVEGKMSSAATTAALKAFAARLGKTTVTTGDAPGFVVNRILAPYLYEAIRLMEQGVPVADIEDAMKRFGMPMGPFQLLDEVGLDICSKVIHVLHEALGERITPPAILAFIEGSKLLGKKGGKGIYLYDATGKRLGLNPDVLAAVKAEAKPKSRGEIQDRLSLVMISEAVRCLEEGVIEDPAQLDLAMIMGTGFPPFRGGVLRFADSIGARVVAQKLTFLSQVAGENYRPCALLVSKAQSGENFCR